MDIVVQLEDGSLANVEVQKIGYAFPGQRSACYSADLLLRQYKRVRSQKGKKFSYRDIKKVYTIVFFEHSSIEFHKMNELYFHRLKQQSDTGIEVELLQEYIFVALDIFKRVLHNKGGNISCELEAWLTFLSIDEPELIAKLIEQYPDFKEYYEEVYDMCWEVEEIMGLFSEELAILDSNTVDYMIDEMQAEIDEKKKILADQESTIADLRKIINVQNKMIDEWKERIKKLEEKNISE